MIVGSYSLDLYCDNLDVKHPYNYMPHQYIGGTRGNCFKQARKDGWKINYKKLMAICPLCNRKKLK